MSKMQTVKLRSGHTMPAIGFGTWQLTENTENIVARAIDVGYRNIDTSGDYGTQVGVGEGIRLSGVNRDQLFVTTKVENHENAYESTLKNLAELKLRSVNLTLIHWPPEDGAGEELWKDLIRAKKEGLTTDIGVSNYSIDEMLALHESTGEMPVVNQVEWSPFGYSKDMLSFAKDNDIILQAYSPLTRGEKLDNPELEKIAKKYGKTPAQVLLRWDIQQGVVPIPKSSGEAHLNENIDVFDFEINQEDMQYLNEQNEQFSSIRDELIYA